jgi:prepilin-type N-terminal cleavage/methylation domain-containing protein
MMDTHIFRIRQKGYTLIELLLYVSIVGVLLTSVVMFYGTALDSRVKNQSIVEVNQQGGAAMEYMAQTIRNASSITLPAAAGTGAQLTLAMPDAGSNPTIFNLSGTTLQVTEGASAAVALTNDKVQITSLSFKNLSRASTPGVVQVTMTVARTNLANRNEYDYQKTFVTSTALRWP